MNVYAHPKDAFDERAEYIGQLFAVPAAIAVQNAQILADTQRLADQAKWIAYGPSRKSSAALVGLYQDGKTEMAPHMPTNPDHMTTAVMDDPEFWADHSAELSERFNSWLAAG